MKALAIINQAPVDANTVQWSFDKVMAAIAFDLEVTVVFMGAGIDHIYDNKAWKSLDMYGVETVYCLQHAAKPDKQALFEATSIDMAQLRAMIADAEMMI